MPNEVLRKTGDHILFAHDNFAPTASGTLSTNYTPCRIDIGGLANAASVQSNKADLGARRAPAFNVLSCIEFETAPTAGAAIEYYWAPSTSATAAIGNTGGTVTGWNFSSSALISNRYRSGLFKSRLFHSNMVR